MGRRKKKVLSPYKHTEELGTLGAKSSSQDIHSSPPAPAAMEQSSKWDTDNRPTKRQKIAGNLDSASTAPTNIGDTNESELGDDAQDSTTAWTTTYRLPSELEHLQARFHFTNMSILSSSKIEQKVRNLLLRSQIHETADEETKAEAVVLCAKGASITKLVSIVEITKRTIAGQGGRWYEYTALNGEMTNMKEKKPKNKEGGKTLRQWEKEHDENQGSTSKGQQDASVSGDPLQPKYEDDEEAAFETMGRQQIMAHDKNPKKTRVIPRITTYISRVPIPGLKVLFGFVELLQGRWALVVIWLTDQQGTDKCMILWHNEYHNTHRISMGQ